MWLSWPFAQWSRHRKILFVWRCYPLFLPWRIQITRYGNTGCGVFKRAHCVLLKHYYSVDFPWWFDRQKNASVEFRQHAQIFKLIWRSNPWMDPLEKNILLHYFLLYFMQVLSFSPWMACFNLNVTDLNFFHKSKAKLVKFVAN